MDGDIPLKPEALSFTLDRQTIEKLADLVTGDEGWAPKRRGSYDLSVFFEECGFPDFEHDGSARRPWVVDRLKAVDDALLAAVILRLASPKEYSGNVHQHAAAIAALNAILSIEGLQVKIDSQLHANLLTSEPSYSGEAGSLSRAHTLDQPDFSVLFSDKDGSFLSARWHEARLCFESGAYMAAIIMIGSVLESVLLLTLRRDYDTLKERSIEVKDKMGEVKPLNKWSLGDMIDVCHKLGWTNALTKQFEHVIREYRNLVHPEVQFRQGFQPGSEECRIAALVLLAAIRDLANKPLKLNA